MKLTKNKLCVLSTWALSIFIVFIFIQSLFFKFSNAPETQYIFGTLDQWAAESFGINNLFLPPGIFNQYVVGTGELITSVLLLAGLFISKWRCLNSYGALIAFGIMTGAIFFHLFTPLGIEVQGDGGALFGSAVAIWVSSVILLYKGRRHFCLGKQCGVK